MFADKHLTLYSEDEVRQVDALDTFPVDAFSVKSLPAGPAWKREQLFHYYDGSVEGRLTMLNVEHLDRVFIPDTYYQGEVTFLRNNNSLVLYKNNSQQILAISNFFSSKHAARAQNIQLVFRNSHVGLQHIYGGEVESLRNFTMGLMKGHMKSRVHSGEAIWEQVRGNYTAHLKGVGKVVFFDVHAFLSNITLTGTAEEGGTLVVGYGDNQLTLHGWDTVTPRFRPLLLFQHSHHTALDITRFAVSEVGNMTEVLGQLRHLAEVE